jgi:hypothetical protein
MYALHQLLAQKRIQLALLCVRTTPRFLLLHMHVWAQYVVLIHGKRLAAMPP